MERDGERKERRGRGGGQLMTLSKEKKKKKERRRWGKKQAKNINKAKKKHSKYETGCDYCINRDATEVIYCFIAL